MTHSTSADTRSGNVALVAAAEARVGSEGVEEMPSLWNADNPAVLVVKRL